MKTSLICYDSGVREIILFDIDYNLVNTGKFKNNYKTRISSLLGVPLEDFLKVEQGYVKKEKGFTEFVPLDYIKYLSESFNAPASDISKAFFHDDNFKDILFDDVIGNLDNLKNDYHLGVYSESFKDYQMFKLHKTGLLPYFESDLIFIFSNKLTEEALSLLPQGCFIVDDNLPVINALKQVGKYKPIWVNRMGDEEDTDASVIRDLNELGSVLKNYSDKIFSEEFLVGDPGIGH